MSGQMNSSRSRPAAVSVLHRCVARIAKPSVSRDLTRSERFAALRAIEGLFHTSSPCGPTRITSEQHALLRKGFVSGACGLLSHWYRIREDSTFGGEGQLAANTNASGGFWAEYGVRQELKLNVAPNAPAGSLRRGPTFGLAMIECLDRNLDRSANVKAVVSVLSCLALHPAAGEFTLVGSIIRRVEDSLLQEKTEKIETVVTFLQLASVAYRARVPLQADTVDRFASFLSGASIGWDALASAEQAVELALAYGFLVSRPEVAVVLNKGTRNQVFRIAAKKLSHNSEEQTSLTVGPSLVMALKLLHSMLHDLKFVHRDATIAASQAIHNGLGVMTSSQALQALKLMRDVERLVTAKSIKEGWRVPKKDAKKDPNGIKALMSSKKSPFKIRWPEVHRVAESLVSWVVEACSSCDGPMLPALGEAILVMTSSGFGRQRSQHVKEAALLYLEGLRTRGALGDAESFEIEPFVDGLTLAWRVGLRVKLSAEPGKSIADNETEAFTGDVLRDVASQGAKRLRELQKAPSDSGNAHLVLEWNRACRRVGAASSVV